MIARLIEHSRSLRFKIVASLFVVLALSIGAAMYGIWTYERDHFINLTNEEARRGAQTIEKALRSSMLKNDRKAIQEAVNEIASLYEPPSRLSIIDPGGMVEISSDPELRGRNFNRFEDRSCIVCHSSRGVRPQKDAVLLEEAGKPLLRNVIKINNGPECYQCHSSGNDILGILVYDASFVPTYALLRSVAFRMLLTGLATFLVISVVLFLAINRLIHEPIRKLMHGFIQVGNGNYDFWVDEKSSSEFGYMADQFNVMSRAIGRFIREIKGKNQETAILYSIVREVSETIEWERLRRIIIDLVHDIFKAEQNGLVVPQQKKEDCVDIIWRVKDEKRPVHRLYRPGSGEDLSFAAVTVEELEEWYRERYSHFRFLDDYQRLLVPLHYGQRSIGLICVKKVVGQRFSRHERAIVPALANHVSISLANSHLYHLAITDGLTDLYSKRHLLNKLEMLVVRNDKYLNETFFLLIMDIDHFKQVNDTYGHQVGDEVLIQMAELLRKNIRLEDIPFRYGGEEFVVLVPSAASETPLGMKIAERLRAAVEAHTFTCPGAPPLRVTISLGVASFPLHGRTADAIIRAADEALYQAKRSGRNRACGVNMPGVT